MTQKFSLSRKIYSEIKAKIKKEFFNKIRLIFKDKKKILKEKEK